MDETLWLPVGLVAFLVFAIVFGVRAAKLAGEKRRKEGLSHQVGHGGTSVSGSAAPAGFKGGGNDAGGGGE